MLTRTKYASETNWTLRQSAVNFHNYYYLNGRGIGDVGNDASGHRSYAESLAQTKQVPLAASTGVAAASWPLINPTLAALIASGKLTAGFFGLGAFAPLAPAAARVQPTGQEVNPVSALDQTNYAAGYEPISANYPAGGEPSYTVRGSGETLQSIALNLFGARDVVPAGRRQWPDWERARRA